MDAVFKNLKDIELSIEDVKRNHTELDHNKLNNEELDKIKVYIDDG